MYPYLPELDNLIFTNANKKESIIIGPLQGIDCYCVDNVYYGVWYSGPLNRRFVIGDYKQYRKLIESHY